MFQLSGDIYILNQSALKLQAPGPGFARLGVIGVGFREFTVSGYLEFTVSGLGDAKLLSPEAETASTLA